MQRIDQQLSGVQLAMTKIDSRFPLPQSPANLECRAAQRLLFEGNFQDWQRLAIARIDDPSAERESVESASDLLEPFRFSRFAQGKLHPTFNSPFPWS